MKSFLFLNHTLASQPARLGVVLARIDQGKGGEALHRSQAPQVLHRLELSTRVASITASNAIENIMVDPDRAHRITRASGTVRFRGRNEQEFGGYRDAIDEITQGNGKERVSIPLLLHVHRTLYKYSGGGGGRLKEDQNYIVEYVDGFRHVIFTPPTPDDTKWMLPELIDRYLAARDANEAHPLVLMAIFVLDLLSIHPAADGNGRLARLMTTHLLLGCGYGVSRYVSIEQRIFETKHEYYDAIRAAQHGWHDAQHNVWPFVTYLCGVLADAYADFAAHVAAATPTTTSKQEQVREFVLEHAPNQFRFRDLEQWLPGISAPTIRLVLRELSADGLIHVAGRGPGATWSRSPRPPLH